MRSIVIRHSAEGSRTNCRSGENTAVRIDTPETSNEITYRLQKGENTAVRLELRRYQRTSCMQEGEHSSQIVIVHTLNDITHSLQEGGERSS